MDLFKSVVIRRKLIEFTKGNNTAAKTILIIYDKDVKSLKVINTLP
jgi:hypothetical protein